MVTRLSSKDAAFFYMEEAASPSHLCTMAVFDRAGARLGYEQVLEQVEQQLQLIPRYHQRVREVAGGLMRPVWVDDADFDITYHVRRSALPRPGSRDQLNDLLARLVSRPLDLGRPLWELYVIEGIEGDRFAVFTKSHRALVDPRGGALDIGQVMLDGSPEPPERREDLWMPRPEPGRLGLMFEGLAGVVSRPASGVDMVRYAFGDVADFAGKTGRTIADVASIVRGATTNGAVDPLSGGRSAIRRFCVAEAELAHFKKVRSRFGGTINDVALAVVAGVLRSWLVSRGHPVTASTSVRALVPLSVYPGDRAAPGTPPAVGDGEQSSDRYPVGPTYGETTVELALVDLPVGEPNAIVRLSQISHAMTSRPGASRAVAARNLMRLSGLTPPTLHAMGSRVTGSMSRRAFHLVVANAPGPQTPMYFAGARMLEMYPVLPLVPGQALSIGITSYDGKLFFGFDVERDAVPDVDVFPALVREAVDELLESL
ncbi:WS/DGAT/MGAT family O-acyltransferase [Tomitella fengzijianii]|uniref:Diacylglycerol O-acyltransferase n=1 Tax=Tomitella fengzijianii TaxID=2597660 RepID=A0A516X148_9ACTN|nr:wax ester/triacylglycerol synthase family O-acyltransferase [Tomitella fengzijianii]QDQ96806.1 wax ester/triacylglycerol synthase family O-acyltransferase [Tomitella fengzijianii]